MTGESHLYLVPVLTELTESLFFVQPERLDELIYKSDGTKKNIKVGQHVGDLLLKKHPSGFIQSESPSIEAYDIRLMKREESLMVCVIFHYILLYCIILYYILLYCIMSHYIPLYCIIFYYVSLYSIMLYYILLYFIILHYIVSYSIILTVSVRSMA